MAGIKKTLAPQEPYRRLPLIIALTAAILATSPSAAQSLMDQVRQREANIKPAPISIVEVGYGPTLPATSTFDWLPPEDNPAKASRMVGIASLDYTINAKGRVATCSVAASSGVTDFDATACKLFKKYARYQPGAASGPLFARYGYRPDQWMTRPPTFIRADFRSNSKQLVQVGRTPDMSGDFGEAKAMLMLAINSMGRVESCSEIDGATSPFIAEGCRAMRRSRFSPPTNERAQPVTRVIYRPVRSTTRP